MNIESNAPVGSWVWVVDSDKVFADRGLASYFGMKPVDAARGLPIRAFLGSVHQADLEGVEEAIIKASATGGAFTRSYRVMTASRGWRHIVASGTCFLPEDGSPRLFPGWIADVSQVMDGQRSTLERMHYMVTKAKTRSAQRVVNYTLDDVLLSIEELLRGN
ncbi:PAS domain-containing protein [Mesorhizobium sp. CAU 1741]|uniref:PAS domain-containing protein n=1 Tax=Mesorhizobium sp. CAU 1741 TaxID=3140366 RepID=UPI00325B7068